MSFLTPLVTSIGTAISSAGIGTVLQGVGSILGAFSSGNTPPVPSYENVDVPQPAELSTSLTNEQLLAQEQTAKLNNRRRLLASELDNKIAVSTKNTRFAATDLAPANTTKATLLGQ